jgi:ketosteroid isomerase-like protein
MLSRIISTKIKCLLCLFLFISSWQLQAQSANDVQQIKDLVQNTFDGIWSKMDVNNIEKYQTKDFLLLEHGEVWTNDTIANYCRRASQQVNRPERINNFEFIEVQVKGDWAWAAYHNHAVFKSPGAADQKRYWLESVVAVRTKKGWKLRMMHSTRGNRE